MALKQIHDDLDAAVAAAYGWPVDLVSAVRQLLATSAVAMTAREIAAAFKGGRESRVTELLAALEALGQARRAGDRYAA
jgi:hypothetical protein